MDIAYSRPRFRTDLVAKPFDEAGHRFVDVTDPDSGKTFRFYEVEYSIACAMDGNRDIGGLVEWAQVELGLEPSPDELRTVISTLADLGYLDRGAAGGGGGFDLGRPGAGAMGGVEEALPPSVGDDFELGNAGKSPLDRSDEEGFDAPEITLGLSGNEAVEAGPGELPRAAPTGSYDDEMPTTIKKVGNLRPGTEDLGEPPQAPIEPTTVQPVLRPVSRARTTDDDGPTNIPPPVADFDEEVSVDLTDHMRIRAADVQEAVRQSKVMPAVQAPDLDGLDAGTAARGPGGDEEEDGSATTEREAPRLAPPPRTKPPMAAATPTTELPDKPAQVSLDAGADGQSAGRSAFPAEHDEPLASPVVEKKSRTGLLLLLLLLVAAAAGAGWYYFIFLPVQDAQSITPAVTTPEPEPEPPPEPEPEPPSATLASVAVEPVEVTAAGDGEIDEILPAGTEVGENDIVVKLDGYQRIQRRIEGRMSDVDRYNRRIAGAEEKKKEAEEKGDESAAARYQRDIDREQNKITEREQEADALRAEMEPYFLRAAVAGKVATERAAGDRVAAGDTVFSVELPPRLEATFTLDEGDAPTKGAKVSLAAKGDGSKSDECVVTKSEGKQVTVSCASDGAFADGAEVVFAQ